MAKGRVVERRSTDAMGERFWWPTGALDRDWALTAAVVALSLPIIIPEDK